MNKTLMDIDILMLAEKFPTLKGASTTDQIGFARAILAAHPGQPEPFTLASVLEWAGVPDACRKDPEQRAEVTAAARDVLAERNRQIEQEGHSVEDDDIYNDQGQLSYAAAGLAVLASDAATDIVCGLTGGLTYADECIGSPDPWPHGWQYKPATPRRNLVKAAAMIVAEIERIDRAGDAS